MMRIMGWADAAERAHHARRHTARRRRRSYERITRARVRTSEYDRGNWAANARRGRRRHESIRGCTLYELEPVSDARLPGIPLKCYAGLPLVMLAGGYFRKMRRKFGFPRVFACFARTGKNQPGAALEHLKGVSRDVAYFY